jgi:hypothetical protein
MNSGNKLFIFSVILIPILLISVNYNAIHDFYTYSVPLNDVQIIHNEDGLESFQTIRDREDSACFTTPSQNYFCYTKPRMHENGGVSFVAGSNGVQGEMHLDPVDTGVFYFTIKNMTKISDDKVMITLADKGYRIGNEETTRYEITDKFEYSTTIKKFDSFVSHCSNYDGTYVTIVQYLGATTINGAEYFMTWHMSASSTNGIACDYPQL